MCDYSPNNITTSSSEIMNLELSTMEQTFFSFDVLKFLFTIASLYIGSIIYRVHKKYDKKYPCFAPGNMWNHFVMATDCNYPMWLLVRGYDNM